jgi:uncharacterized damage-inducible protein DinB
MSSAVALLTTLYEYSALARNRQIDAAQALTAEQLRAAAPGVYGSIHDTLAHMAASQWMWLERIQGRSPHQPPTGADFADLDALRAWWDEQQAASLAYLADLSDADLARPISYTSLDGTPYTRQVWHALMQVVNHQTEHRSQVATLLSQAGVDPPPTDLVVYLRPTG